MTEVAELEQRIVAAMDRIRSGLDRLSNQQDAPDDSGDLAAMQDALDAEKTANAQLEARVTAIKEKQETLVGDLEAKVSKLRDEVELHAQQTLGVKKVNRKLRGNNRALRQANQAGLGDADLINDGMVAELDALRVNRETDRAELDAILVELKPLVEGGANA